MKKSSLVIGLCLVFLGTSSTYGAKGVGNGESSHLHRTTRTKESIKSLLRSKLEGKKHTSTATLASHLHRTARTKELLIESLRAKKKAMRDASLGGRPSSPLVSTSSIASASTSTIPATINDFVLKEVARGGETLKGKKRGNIQKVLTLMGEEKTRVLNQKQLSELAKQFGMITPSKALSSLKAVAKNIDPTSSNKRIEITPFYSGGASLPRVKSVKIEILDK